MLRLQNVSYTHADKTPLLSDITITVPHRVTIGLIGNNGTGKSTLLRIIAGDLIPSAGSVIAEERAYYIPQVFGQYDHLTVAQALRAHDKLVALRQILEGNVSDELLTTLGDDWDIEERCTAALAHWQLTGVDLSQPLGTLSGGQKAKVFLAGLSLHQPPFILLDEPGNHLDGAGRELLHTYITSANATIVIVSHDRELLRRVSAIYELDQRGINIYGGNYDFYTLAKQAEENARENALHSKEKELQKARATERETMERQQRLDARGQRKQEKAGMPRIMMNTMRNNAENSTARAKETHAAKTGNLARELSELRSAIPAMDRMKLNFDESDLRTGKTLYAASGINFRYGYEWLWPAPLDVHISSGDRIAVTGNNGTGKSTLVKIILGQIEPQHGAHNRSSFRHVYIDQDYSLLANSLTVFQQAQLYNDSGLQEHEIKSKLTHFLFGKDSWHKPCSALSGGERMKLALCCLTISRQAPHMIVLDEPTNNLDIRNVEILTAAVRSYQGTVIAISHDRQFLHEVGITREIQLSRIEGR